LIREHPFFEERISLPLHADAEGFVRFITHEIPMNQNRFSLRWLAQLVLALGFISALVGCGPSIATVHGTVTYKGEKVKGGTIIFSPVKEGANSPGPPAAGTVQADGTFVLKSEAGSGAVIGKNNVTYTSPGGEASTDPDKEGTPSPYINLVPKDSSVEVKSGSNNFTIELK
jgi:hypothetical protein